VRLMSPQPFTQKSTVIITGVAGLLGNNLARYLLQRNYQVVGIDDLSGGYLDLLPTHPDFFFFQDDVSVLDSEFSKFRSLKVKCVFHFAAYAAEGLSPFIRKFNYTNNLIKSIDVINFCLKTQTKLIFASSMAVYGNNTAPFRESQTCDPIDPYGIAKFAVELDIKQAHSQFNLNYNIIRPHNVIGIYQNIFDRYRNVLGIFIRNVIDEVPMLIYGTGEQKRAFSDVKFMLPIFDKLITSHSNETFNLGADREIKILDLAKKVLEIGKVFGFKPRIELAEKRHEVEDAFCDHSKAKEQLGYKDETDIDAIISDMFEWSISQPKRKVKSIEYEYDNNIYDYWK